MRLIKWYYHISLPVILILTLVVGLTPPHSIDGIQTTGNQMVIAHPETQQEKVTQDNPPSDVQTKSATPKVVSVSTKRATTTPSPSRSQSSKTTATAISTSGTETNSKALVIVNTAKQYLGVKYVWGGTTPSGFDCSGFTKYVFAKNGITLPRISRDQYNIGQPVAFSSLQPADLVFFSMDGDKIIDHVGIYIGGGQFIQASSSKGVLITSLSSYWKSRYLGAKRVL